MEKVKNEDKLLATDIVDTNIADRENDELVNLEELEFEPIHTTLQYNNKKIHIFNPDENQTKELMDVVMEYSKIDESGQVQTNIPANIVISKVMRILTDLKFPEEQEKIDKIINNPKPILQEVLLIVTSILQKTMEINFKSLQLTKDSLEKMGITDEKMMELVDKQKEIQELSVELEKEKQETAKVEATKNKDLVKELIQKVNQLENEKIELQAKLEPKTKRKYTKKKKTEKSIKDEENLGSEINNG